MEMKKLLFHCVGWKEGNEFVGTNSKGFQREHDPDPKQGLKQRWWSPASGMESDSQGRWPMAVVALSREEHGMQWREIWHTESHWVMLVMTLSYQNLPWSQCLLYPTEKPSVLPGELWCSCSVPSSEKQARGLLLQRQPRGRSRGLAEAERLRGNYSSFTHCTGNYVRENNQLKLGFVHVKPTADPI